MFLEHPGNISTSPLCPQTNPTERRSGHPSRLSCCVYSPLAAHTSWHPAAFENLSGGPRSSQTDPVKHSSGTAVKIVCLNSLPRRCQHMGSTGAEAAQLANFFRATAPSRPPPPPLPPSAPHSSSLTLNPGQALGSRAACAIRSLPAGFNPEDS